MSEYDQDLEQLEFETREFDVVCTLCQLPKIATEKELREQRWTLSTFGTVCPSCTVLAVKERIEARQHTARMIERCQQVPERSVRIHELQGVPE